MFGVYFPKNNKTDWDIERHRIKVPTLKWVKIKEYGYIPSNSNVISGMITKHANRYFISLVCEVEEISNNKSTCKSEGIGIDLGIKEFAVCSNGTIYNNINKTEKVKELKKRLKREQKKLSRKYESLKVRSKNKKEGRATRQNIQKQVVKVQKLHFKLTNIRTNYINNIVSEVIKQNPSFITIEDLNVSGMMKNRHLSKAISEQKFYEFRTKLTNKCRQNEIEIRVVNRFYASSKKCSCCGNKKSNLELKDRIYVCESCGLEMNRDLNASINLKESDTYLIA